MKARAIESLCKYWDGFSTEYKNPFAYFTTIIYNSFLRVLQIQKKINKGKHRLFIAEGVSLKNYPRDPEDDEEESKLEEVVEDLGDGVLIGIKVPLTPKNIYTLKSDLICTCCNQEKTIDKFPSMAKVDGKLKSDAKCTLCWSGVYTAPIPPPKIEEKKEEIKIKISEIKFDEITIAKVKFDRCKEIKEKANKPENISGIKIHYGRKALDLVGQKFGKLTVMERATNSKTGEIRWLCKCDCGSPKPRTVFGISLKNGTSTSCGCMRKSLQSSRMKQYHRLNPNKNRVTPSKIAKDLVGQKFGKLTVIKREDVKNGSIRWLCSCDCGSNEPRIVYGFSLKNGDSTSCGCVRKASTAQRAREQAKIRRQAA